MLTEFKDSDFEDKIKKDDIVFIGKGIPHRIQAVGNKPAIRLAVSREDVAHVYPDGDSS